MSASPSTDCTATTFGQIAAAVIIKTKRAAEAEGRIYRQSDLAAVIDALLPAWLEKQGVQTQPTTFSLESPPPARITPKPDHFGTGKEMPPAPALVTAYSTSIGYPIDGQKWCDSYAAKGWIVSGKAKMKDWHAAVRNWKTNRWGRDNGIALHATSTAPSGAIQPPASRYSRI